MQRRLALMDNFWDLYPAAVNLAAVRVGPISRTRIGLDFEKELEKAMKDVLAGIDKCKKIVSDFESKKSS